MHEFNSVIDTSAVNSAGAVELTTVGNAATAFSRYEALQSDGQRRVVSSQIHPEWQVLDDQKRRALSSNAYDLYRNCVLLSWALRRHVDWICSWAWRPNSGDPGLNKDLAALMERDSRPYQCDAGGRHSWARLLRLSELQTQLVGDCVHVPLRSGHIQSVESHYIRNPTSSRRDSQQWKNGCKLGAADRTVAMCIHELLNDGTARERIIPRSRLWHHACMDFRFKQVRGISPITTAMMAFRDNDTTIEDIRSKLKMEAILGVAFFQQHGSANPFQSAAGDPKNDTPGLPPFYNIGKGAIAFGMKHGETIDTFQLSNPSTQTQEFLKLSIMVAIKAFDLPFNFFEECLIKEDGRGHSSVIVPSLMINVCRCIFSVPGLTQKDRSTRRMTRRINCPSRIGSARLWSSASSAKHPRTSSTCSAMLPERSTPSSSSISRSRISLRSFISVSLANSSSRKPSGAAITFVFAVSYSLSSFCRSLRLWSILRGSMAARSFSFRSTASRSN